MKVQNIRRTIALILFLLFPIFYNYLSPVLMVMGAGEGVVTASVFFWIIFFVISLIIGRAACSHMCPFGTIQNIMGNASGQRYKYFKYLKSVKYIIFVAWIISVIYFAFNSGGLTRINLFYDTERMVSVDSVGGLIRYYILISAPLIVNIILGKMGFCHYLCPFSALNILGSRIKNLLRIPSLRLESEKNKCINCMKCEKVCPMNIKVSQMVQEENTLSDECILCGECSNACNFKALKRRFNKGNGKGGNSSNEYVK